MCGAVTRLLCPRLAAFARRTDGSGRRPLRAGDVAARKQLTALRRGSLLAWGGESLGHVHRLDRSELVLRVTRRFVVLHHEVTNSVPVAAKALLGDAGVKVSPNQVGARRARRLQLEH